VDHRQRDGVQDVTGLNEDVDSGDGQHRFAITVV